MGESWCAAGVASTDHHRPVEGQDTSMRIEIGILTRQYRAKCVAGCSADVAVEMRFEASR